MKDQPRIRRQPATGQGESVALAIPPAPADFLACNERLGAMCGHGAFAAALGLSVRQACDYFPEVAPDRGWVNIPEMEAAMRRAEVGHHSTFQRWPHSHGVFRTGLVIIQFEGTWLNPGVPPGAACRHTHWIATCTPEGGLPLVYDVNLAGWVTRQSWERAMADELRRELDPKSTGWRIKRGYEVAANPIR